MPISISNLPGLQNRLSLTNAALGTNLAQLASGMSINSAADNPAGLAMSTLLQSQISSIDQATGNISQGSALLRTAEGGMSQISDLLTQGRQLAVQAANGTYSPQQRQALNDQFTAIKNQIDQVTQTTSFNGQPLLSGQLGPGSQNPVTVQAGTGATANDRITINNIKPTDTNALGIANNAVDTPANALATIQNIDSAINSITQNRAGVGALQNRFDVGVQNLSVAKENLTAANNQIMGLDYAAASTQFATNKLLTKAGISALKAGLQTQGALVGSLLNIKG